jgi:hypothetical protein
MERFVVVDCCFHGSAAQSRAMASSFSRFRDHTQRRATVGRTPLDEWSACRRDLYLTTHNTHNRHPCPGGIRTHDLSRRAAVDLRLSSRGHWDRRYESVYVEIHKKHHNKWCIPADSPSQNNCTGGRERSYASQFISVYNRYKNTIMRHFLEDGLAGKVHIHGHPRARFDPSWFILIGICKELHLNDNIQTLPHLKERIQNAADQVSSKTCYSVHGKRWSYCWKYSRQPSVHMCKLTTLRQKLFDLLFN